MASCHNADNIFTVQFITGIISVPNLSACAVCVLCDRNSKVEYLDQMDVFKAINFFTEHMINQKSFFKAV